MVETLRSYILNKEYYPLRRPSGIDFAAEYAEKKLEPRARLADRFARICAMETPLIMPGERIVLTRTITDMNAIFIKEEGKDRIDLPCMFTKEEWLEVKSKHFIHEAGFLSNVIPDFAKILSRGLLDYRKDADVYGQQMIDALFDLCDRYAQAAKEQGRNDIAETLAQVPRYPARNFREALQMIRIINFAAWLEGNYHITMGRFDLYCWPYLQADLESGVHTEDSALDLLCDFFLSFNKDTDLYFSILRGDNGQSITLGGVDREGKPVFNTLSRLCLLASKRLQVIDPKINIRVNKETPLEIYELGSELTAVGLGFPQYTNDDIVIPGFMKLGYSLEDARDYAIAACWEIIVPVLSADIINVGALSLAKVVDKAFHEALPTAKSFEEFYAAVKEGIFTECDAITGSMRDLWFIPSPFYGLFFPFEDISKGGKYNNFGIHGTGVATAADSLAAIKNMSLKKSPSLRPITLPQWMQTLKVIRNCWQSCGMTPPRWVTTMILLTPLRCGCWLTLQTLWNPSATAVVAASAQVPALPCIIYGMLSRSAPPLTAAERAKVWVPIILQVSMPAIKAPSPL